ncbi:hypothetical protein PG988_005616 [Apiospora saccharicola]
MRVCMLAYIIPGRAEEAVSGHLDCAVALDAGAHPVLGRRVHVGIILTALDVDGGGGEVLAGGRGVLARAAGGVLAKAVGAVGGVLAGAVGGLWLLRKSKTPEPSWQPQVPPLRKNRSTVSAFTVLIFATASGRTPCVWSAASLQRISYLQETKTNPFVAAIRTDAAMLKHDDIDPSRMHDPATRRAHVADHSGPVARVLAGRDLQDWFVCLAGQKPTAERQLLRRIRPPAHAPPY